MKVLAVAANRGGLGHQRIVLPARAVAALTGWQVTVVEPGDPMPDGRYDLLVLQNCVWPEQPALIREAQTDGTAVVVDIDDAMPLIPPGNLAYQAGQGEHRAAWLACLDLADTVTCSTPGLVERYGGPRAHLLRNCVPASWLDLPRYDGPTTIGWSGDLRFHAGDLESTRGAVGAVAAEVGARVRVVGFSAGVREALRLPEQVELIETGWVDYDGYAGHMRRATVGIVPLVGSVFASCKSWLKGLEFAALGVPFVESAWHPEYRALALGWPAWKSRQWRSQLRRLLTDSMVREEWAVGSREQVRERHTHEGNAWRWADAWSAAVAHRTGRAA